MSAATAQCFDATVIKHKGPAPRTGKKDILKGEAHTAGNRLVLSCSSPCMLLSLYLNAKKPTMLHLLPSAAKVLESILILRRLQKRSFVVHGPTSPDLEEILAEFYLFASS